jgi:fatty-acyl-CoA synthase
MDKNTYLYRWETVAKTIPDIPVICYGDQTLTWRQWDKRANQLARALLDLGVKREEKVGIMQYNSTQYMEAIFGIFKIAACPVNVNYRYYENELHYIIDNSDAVALILNEDFVDRIQKIKHRLKKVRHYIVVGDAYPADMLEYEQLVSEYPNTKPDLAWPEISNDDTFFVYTGGTTGIPKGVIWRQEDGVLGMIGVLVKGLADNTKRFADAPILLFDSKLWTNRFNQWVLRRNIVEKTTYPLLSTLFNHPELISSFVKGRLKAIISSPLMHGTALVGGFTFPMLGATDIFLTGKRFDARELWETVERIGKTATRKEVLLILIVGDAFAVPMVEELGRRHYDTSAVNLVFSSGTLWSPEVKRKMLEYMPQMIIQDVLGATEGLTTGYATTSTDKDIPKATFRIQEKGPVPVKVINGETGKDVRPGSGEIGVMAIGGHIPMGYWKDPEKTGNVFRTIDGKRYNMFGDMATVDENGFVQLIGRGSECINTGGEKVYPEEVEEIIVGHPKVEDAGVVGTPHDRWGEAVTAVVVLREGESVSEEEIIAFCQGKIADYKKPKRVVFVPSLDRMPSGKKEYKLLRQRALEALDLKHGI